MKQIALLCLALAFPIMSSAQNDSKFTLKANLKGLVKGDTIIVTRAGFPIYTAAKQGDTLIVKKDGQFTYKGRENGYWRYYLSIHTLSKKKWETKTGSSCFLGNGTTYMDGELDYFFAADLRGAFYDDELISNYTKADSKTDLNREKAISIANKARAEKNEELAKKHMDLFNQASKDTMVRHYRKQLEKRRDERSALIFATRMYSISAKDLKEYSDSLDPEAKNTSVADYFKKMLEIKSKVALGEIIPDFEIPLRDGGSKKPSDLRGKYLLLYNWGICPGVIQIHPMVLEFYKKHKDSGLEIMSITRGSTYDLEGELSKQEVIKPIYNHPWICAQDDDEGSLSVNLDLSSTPQFIFISPEGKIIAAGSWDAFKEIQKIMDPMFEKAKN